MDDRILLVFKPNEIEDIDSSSTSSESRIIISGVILENSCIRFVESAKNLGLVIDSVLNFEEQIDKVVQSCFMSIRELSKVKMCLTQQ